MNKIFKSIIGILKDFIYNSFWRSGPVLAIIVLSLVLNGFLWYIFETRIRENPVPFFFTSGLVGLNLILGNYLWEREKIASFFLISVGLFVQLLMLVFVRFLTMVF
ncbi:MAG TPA: hypothetical protein VJK26_00330 [Patescibacteria group bacterium]|nr:hypothetical protein [Patescibacteria group bacterium]